MSLLCARRATAALLASPLVLRRCIAAILPDPKILNEVARLQTVSSLNSLKIRSSDFIDASGLAPLAVAFDATQKPNQLWYNLSKKFESPPFPPASKGFLYYHNDTHTPLESGIRLRLTPSNSPSSSSSLLASGQDLIAPSGAPWHIPLPALVLDRMHTGIINQLLRENMVTQKQLWHCRTLFGKRWKQWAPQLITRLTQEFPADFSGILNMTVVAGEAIHRLKLAHIFGLEAPGPWTGSAIVRFEPSTLPKYAGSRVLHLRILRIVTPVTPDTTRPRDVRIAKPEPGALLTTLSRPSSLTVDSDTDVPANVEVNADAELESAPWAYNIDRQTANGEALRALWEVHNWNPKPSIIVHPL
ncbi:hypothetical protein C8F04DRAFT_98403 [Mycena alexandri]|uniref:Uncharacterized protein n=1 Tax=Mycena alexandri TaxID=1745969 RepID=A0AAD6T9G8_9AGAR|nr:hypothetical protein C8F04DRAFT_98403 [Mycena alexandri]